MKLAVKYHSETRYIRYNLGDECERPTGITEHFLDVAISQFSLDSIVEEQQALQAAFVPKLNAAGILAHHILREANDFMFRVAGKDALTCLTIIMALEKSDEFSLQLCDADIYKGLDDLYRNNVITQANYNDFISAHDTVTRYQLADMIAAQGPWPTQPLRVSSDFLSYIDLAWVRSLGTMSLTLYLRDDITAEETKEAIGLLREFGCGILEDYNPQKFIEQLQGDPKIKQKFYLQKLYIKGTDQVKELVVEMLRSEHWMNMSDSGYTGGAQKLENFRRALGAPLVQEAPVTPAPRRRDSRRDLGERPQF